MQLTSKTLTSSEILNLRTTPIEVVPTPGSGFYTVPLMIVLRTKAGSNVYSNLTSSLGLVINNINISPQMSTDILTTSYDSFAYYTVSNSSSPLRVSDFDNQPVYLKNTGLLNLSGGNGTLEVWITYESYNI